MTNASIEVLKEVFDQFYNISNSTDIVLGKLILDSFGNIQAVQLLDGGDPIKKEMFYMNPFLERNLVLPVIFPEAVSTTTEEKHSHYIPEQRVMQVILNQEYNSEDIYAIAKINKGKQFIILHKVKKL